MLIKVMPNPWNSLEVGKMIISALTPIIVAILAFRFNRLIKKREKIQWTNQKVLEKRIEIYDTIVPGLNDILCYYAFIGNWKELTPINIVETKRFLDKKVNIYAPLFSLGLLSEYNNYIDLCFESFTGWGNDAKIKSLYIRRKECQSNWQDEWDEYFSSEYIDTLTDDDKIVEDITNIRNQYLYLLEILKSNLDIFRSGTYEQSDFPTINFK
jgi:hypothetical protein